MGAAECVSAPFFLGRLSRFWEDGRNVMDKEIEPHVF